MSKKCLLAHTYDPNKHNIDGWWISEKLDGVRALFDGEFLFSRTGKKLYPPAYWIEEITSGALLDGELFIDRGKFQETVSIVRTVKEDKGWHKIKYKIFDTPIPDTSFEERMNIVDEMCKNSKYLEPVKHWKPSHSIENELDIVLQKGGEGLMLREPQSNYVWKRSKTLLKVKKFFDEEATVLSYLPGKGKHEGRMGALGVTWKGKMFKIGTGFDDKQRENPPPIGSKVTFKFQELTKGGIPRFPVFMRVRDDL